jgi:hypothetical protein
MRMAIRSLGGVCLALLSVVALTVAWTTTMAVQLAATALIMGGTQNSLGSPETPISYINPYLSNAVNRFINPASEAPTGTGGSPIPGVGADDDQYAVITPEQFFPATGSMTFDASVMTGLANLARCVRGSADCKYNDNPEINPGPPAGPPVAGDEFDIFGYSQSAVIASLLKKDMIQNPEKYPDVGPGDASFFLLANPMRPNGGILARGPLGLTIPILGVTFYGATPTNSCQTGECYQTVDVAAQYDGMGGDAAVSLLNPLALLNATLGIYYLHGNMQNGNFSDAQYQGSYGDTDYYLVPTRRLPLLMPFESFVPSPILTFLDAPLRVLVEGGYAHDINPGIAVSVGLLPFRDPIKTLINFVVAIPTGLDDAIAEATGNPGFRPLGTKPVTSPFGVGGPELPAPPAAADDADLLSHNGDDAREENVDEKITEGDTVEELADDEPPTGDVAEEDETDGKATEKLDLTVPGIVKHFESRFGRPLVRGPIKFDSQDDSTTPSPAKPGGDGDGDGDGGDETSTHTKTSEPDSTPSDAGGEAAA